MDPTSRAILLCGGAVGEEYIGTYKFTTPRTYNSYQWQVPAQTSYIQAVAWGSGGASMYNTGFWCTYFGYCGGHGGAGGFATAVIPVTAGETLLVGVGRDGNNGGHSSTASNDSSSGGFTSIFRSSTPLLIAGGGGSGGERKGNGGAGGGLTGQTSWGLGETSLGGTQTAGGVNQNYIGSADQYGYTGSYLTGGRFAGGGGYYGGAGGNKYENGGGGGSSYIGATGNLHSSTTAGNNLTPPEQQHPDYISSATGTIHNRAYAFGGDYSGTQGPGTGLLVIHALGGGYDPANTPVIPASRTILATY